MNEIIKILHKETKLPIDYLIFEMRKSKELKSTTKVDCIHFVHWNLINHAYSTCNHYGKYLINMDKNCCKNCKYYKSRVCSKSTSGRKRVSYKSIKLSIENSPNRKT